VTRTCLAWLELRISTVLCSRESVLLEHPNHNAALGCQAACCRSSASRACFHKTWHVGVLQPDVFLEMTSPPNILLFPRLSSVAGDICKPMLIFCARLPLPPSDQATRIQEYPSDQSKLAPTGVCLPLQLLSALEQQMSVSSCCWNNWKLSPRFQHLQTRIQHLVDLRVGLVPAEHRSGSALSPWTCGDLEAPTRSSCTTLRKLPAPCQRRA